MFASYFTLKLVFFTVLFIGLMEITIYRKFISQTHSSSTQKTETTIAWANDSPLWQTYFVDPLGHQR